MEGVVLTADLSLYRGKKVLVTGHTGFKGAWLCQWLNLLGAEVYGIALDPPTSPSLFEDARVAHLLTRDMRCDVRERGQVLRYVRECSPHVVFHLAAQPLVRQSYRDPVETYETNVLGAVHVLEAVRETLSVEHFICITTDKCYAQNTKEQCAFSEDDPLGGDDPYSASKACAELICHSYFVSFFSGMRKIHAATARAGNVIGGGDWAEDRLIPDIVRALQKAQSVVLRNPAYVRPWQHVLEALHGYLLLGAASMDARFGAVGGAWNFGPKECTVRSVKDLAATFFDVWGAGTYQSCKNEQDPEEARYLMLSSDKARKALSWHNIWDFDQTVHETVLWYRGYIDGRSADDLCREQLLRYMNQAEEGSD